MKPALKNISPGKREMYDLVVVGAGPAGCSAAAAAADAGLTVAILEKHLTPRDKTCGGLLSSQALSQLPAGLSLEGEAFLPVHKIAVNTRHQSTVHEEKHPLGMVTLRSRLDSELLSWALSRGAVLLEECPLRRLDRERGSREGLFRLETPPKTVWSRYIIGADGAYSTTARLAGIRNKFRPWQSGFGVSALIKNPDPIDQPAESTITFYPLPLLGGFGWEFPGPGFLNVGAGGWHPFRSRIMLFFNRLYGETFARVRGEGSKPRSWPLPFTGPLGTIQRGRILLAGDAAGMTDPFAGEGICHALKSGRIAAESIIQAEKSGAENCGALYTRSIRRELFTGFCLSMAGACILRWPLMGKHLSRKVNGGLAGVVAGIMSQPDWYRRNLLPLLSPFAQLGEEC